jgi:hypothetical protein
MPFYIRKNRSMKALKTSILVIVIIFINIIPSFSLPPGWEVVDVRYDINDLFSESHCSGITCADSNNCIIWGTLYGRGGFYF